MLIRKEHIQNGALLGVWEIAESRDELLRLYPETLRQKAETDVAKIRSERRAREWLCTRIMLSLLLDEEKTICHHPNGRPYFRDESYQISISHTTRHAAVLLHPTLHTGIDIEARSERVKKVAHKFISEKEFVDGTQKTVHQLLHWSAKETLFKLIREEGVDFRQHLFIEPFTPQVSGIMTAHESKTPACHTFQIRYEVHPEYVLTWGFAEETGSNAKTTNGLLY